MNYPYNIKLSGFVLKLGINSPVAQLMSSRDFHEILEFHECFMKWMMTKYIQN